MSQTYLNTRMRGSLISIAIAAITVFMVACQAPPSASAPKAGTGPAESAAGKKVKVVYWAHDFVPRADLDKKYIAEFMKANPDIEVEYDVQSEFDTKLTTAIAAGTGPDLTAQWNAFIGQFHAANFIAPVDFQAIGFNSQKELMDQYEAPENILSGAMFKGDLYGIPNELSIYACYTNNKLWKDAGLDPAKDFPTTWEDLVPIAQKLTKRDAAGKLTQRGFDFNWTDPVFMWLTFGAQVRQLGGTMINEDTNIATVNTPEVAQVLQYWTDWVNKYKLGGPAYQGSRDAMQASTLAIECTMGSWAVDAMKKANIDYGVYKVPTWQNAKNKNYFDTYAYFHMVNAKSPDDVRRAAWKLAWYLDSQPEAYLTSAGLLQPRKILINSSTFKNTPNLSLFLDEMTSSFYSPRIPAFTEAAAALARMRDRCVTQGMDVKTSMTQGQQELSDILAKQKS